MIYGAVIVLTTLLQSSNVGFPAILGARPFLLLPLVVSIAMHEREIPAAVFGVVTGIMWDVTSAKEGFSALVLMLLSVTCSVLISHIMRNNIITAFVLGAGALATYQVLYIFVNIILSGAGGGLRLLFTFYLPSFVYTIVFIPVFYYLVKYIFSSHRATDE